MRKEHNCTKCNTVKEILHKKMCSPCYYKDRREKDPESSRLKNRKAYYKKAGKSLEQMQLSNFRKPGVRKSRQERNANRTYKLALATPKWLSFEDYKEMLSLHNDNESVDHIIPISHPDVCGLNVPWNIQGLSIEANNFKKCKFDGTYENESWRLEFEKWKSE